jgi:xanthine dehydrogenase iron-sulfur cluster and FAD-binding subunit A
LEIKFKGCVYPTIFCPNQVAEMISVSITASGLKVGASVTLTDLEINLEEHVTKLPS